jgi:hypothetical protein
MTTVYVVTRGDYSEYRIVCVCLDKAIADALAERNEDYSVEEYEALDTLPEVVEELRLRAAIMADGKVEETERIMGHTPVLDEWDVDPCAHDVWVHVYGVPSIEVIVRGSDHERVRKVYSEKKAQAIADFDLLVAKKRAEMPSFYAPPPTQPKVLRPADCPCRYLDVSWETSTVTHPDPNCPHFGVNPIETV